MGGEVNYDLSCDCGAVSMCAAGTPVASVHCHCGSCRSLYHIDILSAVAWPEEGFTAPAREALYEYRHPTRNMRRFGCRHCGTIMYGRHAPGIPVIPHGVFRANNGGELPAGLAPTLHLFYGERVLEMGDDLPKSEADELLDM